MYKIVKIVLIVLGLIGVILWVQLPSGDAPAAEAIQSGALNMMFIITFVLMAIAILFSLVFSLVHMFSRPSSLKKTLFVIVGFLIVLGLSYALATGTDVNIDEMARRGISTSEAVIRRIGMGLNMFFILLILAIASLIWGGVRKMTN